jgi:hypothetical protein
MEAVAFEDGGVESVAAAVVADAFSRVGRTRDALTRGLLGV